MNVHLFPASCHSIRLGVRKYGISVRDSKETFGRYNVMIHKKADGEFIESVTGVVQKTLVYGENTSMTKFKLKRGAVIPPHMHPHEQTGYLVSGRIRMHIEDSVHELEAGDAWCIPGDTEHSADALEDAVAVEVFSPVREDYIPAP